MMKRSIALLCVCSLLALSAVQLASQDAPEAPAASEPVLEAWAGLQTARAENQQLRDAVNGLFQKMETEEGKSAAREVFMTALRQGGTLVWKAETAFREEFDASDWAKWEGEAHDEMYLAGLNLSARHALDHHPKKALETYELLIKHFPDSPEAERAKSTWLPIALPAAGDYEHAVTRLTELKGELDEPYGPGMRMAIGDVYALKGDAEKALAEYQGALDDIASVGEFTSYDRRLNVKRYCELRVALIGKEAPEVDSSTWIGGEPKKLSDLRGQVVVLDYWATW